MKLKSVVEAILGEKLLLKPGPNGWDLYGKLVAEAYLKAPAHEPSAVPAFEALVPFIEKMFKQIQSKVNVEFVDFHPYKNDQEVRNDIVKNKLLRIATVDSDHAVFDKETNAKFRTVHDYMAHFQRHTAFGLEGEIKAYNAHLQTVPSKAIPALFTEVLGQACTSVVTGKFAEQKIVLLKGFDYLNVGVVDGYDIVGKELKKGHVA